MLRPLLAAIGALALAWPAFAQVPPYPADFHTREIAAANVQSVVIPHSGHWLMEENPGATIAAVVDFLQ